MPILCALYGDVQAYLAAVYAGGQPQVLAFIIPETVSANARPAEFTVTVDEIEAKTRLDFMAELPDDEEERIEAGKAGVW